RVNRPAADSDPFIRTASPQVRLNTQLGIRWHLLNRLRIRGLHISRFVKGHPLLHTEHNVSDGLPRKPPKNSKYQRANEPNHSDYDEYSELPIRLDRGG